MALCEEHTFDRMMHWKPFPDTSVTIIPSQRRGRDFANLGSVVTGQLPTSLLFAEVNCPASVSSMHDPFRRDPTVRSLEDQSEGLHIASFRACTRRAAEIRACQNV